MLHFENCHFKIDFGRDHKKIIIRVQIKMGIICSSHQEENGRKRQKQKVKKRNSKNAIRNESTMSPRFTDLSPDEKRFLEAVEKHRALRSKKDLLFLKKQRENKERFRKIAEENVKSQVEAQNELMKRGEEKDYITVNMENSLIDNRPKIEENYFPENVRRLQLRNCIGIGSWGTIYLAEICFKRKQICAVKIFSDLKLEREPIPGYLETTTLKKLNHPHIVKYISNGRFQENYLNGSPYLVLENVSGGSLKEKLDILEKGSGFQTDFILGLTLDILKALVYLHYDQNIVHRDLKPANILLEPKDRCAENGIVDEINQQTFVFKLCDFGSARQLDDQNDSVFTHLYAAPELVDRNPHHSGACDVYSLGLILLQCALGFKPAGKLYIILV